MGFAVLFPSAIICQAVRFKQKGQFFFLSCWSQFLLAPMKWWFVGIKPHLKCLFLTYDIASAQPRIKLPRAVIYFLQNIWACLAEYIGMDFPRIWWLFDNRVGFFFFWKLPEKYVHFKRSLVRKPFQAPCGNPVRVDSDYGTLQIRVKYWWVLMPLRYFDVDPFSIYSLSDSLI